MYRRAAVVGLVVLGVIAGGSQAGVYRWTDEKGRVHFSDRPPDRDAEQLDIPDARPPGGARFDQQQRDVERMEKQRRLLDLYREEREEKQRQRAARETRERQRAANCVEARERLARFESYSYLYKPLPDGDKRIFTEAERQQATERARAEVARWCD